MIGNVSALPIFLVDFLMVFVYSLFVVKIYPINNFIINSIMTVKKLKLSIAEIKNSGPEIYFTKEDMPTTDKERESVLLGRLNFYNYVCNNLLFLKLFYILF